MKDAIVTSSNDELVGIITMNQAEKLNALNADLIRGLVDNF
jgi:enoyl-CoA hydratase/carnithine racemase